MKKEIHKLSQLATSAIIEHKAFLQADAHRRNLNLSQFRGEVINDIPQSSDSEDAEKVFSTQTDNNLVEIPDDYYGMLYSEIICSSARILNCLLIDEYYIDIFFRL